MHPSTAAILRHFRYEHLPERLQAVSRPCAELAQDLAERLPSDPETTAGLRKLLEAKDCFVRAALTTGVLLLAVIGVSPPAAGVELRFRWEPATGPVATYDVLVQRDGGPYTIEQSVPAGAEPPEATIEGEIGEALTVRVGAVAADGRVGPLSEPSAPVHVLGDPDPLTAPSRPTLIQITP